MVKKALLLLLKLALFLLATALLTEAGFRAYHQFNPSFIFPGRGYDRFRGRPHSLSYSVPLNAGGFRDQLFVSKVRSPGSEQAKRWA